jgi:hypothetical protein
MTERDTVIAAVNQLEDLAADAKNAVNEIRANLDDKKWAYWRLYNLRSELSAVVATLGAGRPQAGSWRKR